jgi:enoyl-CoA hydratase/carnithine racemase
MVSMQISGGVAVLELTRPERGNALSAALVDAVLDKLPGIFADQALHSLVIRGAGRHLCTGFDLEGLEQQSDGDLLHRFVRIETLLAELWHAPLRTIAMATGRVYGAGADLFTACDLRIAQPSTTFRFPGAGFGIVLGTRRLAARVGDDRAREWVTMNTQVDAETALACGLATQIVDSELDPTQLPVPVVARASQCALHEASRADYRDRDMAALVRSAAIPGLRDRILRYAANVRATGMGRS